MPAGRASSVESTESSYSRSPETSQWAVLAPEHGHVIVYSRLHPCNIKSQCAPARFQDTNLVQIDGHAGLREWLSHHYMPGRPFNGEHRAANRLAILTIMQ